MEIDEDKHEIHRLVATVPSKQGGRRSAGVTVISPRKTVYVKQRRKGQSQRAVCCVSKIPDARSSRDAIDEPRENFFNVNEIVSHA